MKYYLAIWLFLAFPINDALSQPVSDWETAQKIASAQLLRNNCADAWDTYWPWIKIGITEAMFIVGYTTNYRSWISPGGHSDFLALNRQSFILLMHAAKGGGERMDYLIHTLGSYPITGYVRRRIKQCLSKASTPESCIQNEVDLGSVPDLETYILEIESLSQSGSRSRCKRDVKHPLIEK